MNKRQSAVFEAKGEINKYKEIYSFRNICFSNELLICSVKIALKKYLDVWPALYRHVIFKNVYLYYTSCYIPEIWPSLLDDLYVVFIGFARHIINVNRFLHNSFTVVKEHVLTLHTNGYLNMKKTQGRRTSENESKRGRERDYKNVYELCVLDESQRGRFYPCYTLPFYQCSNQ